MNTFLNTLEQGFLKLDRTYLDSVNQIQKLTAFDFKKESEMFYNALGYDFLKLVDIFSRTKTDDEFYAEIKDNREDENYLKRIDMIMNNQYDFIKDFRSALHHFYYDKEEFDSQVDILLKTFKNVVTDANIHRLLTRGRKEIDEIFEASKGNPDFPDIPYYLLQEQIANHDRFMFDEFGVLPEQGISNEKLGAKTFIQAIQSIYIWIFHNLEIRIKLYSPTYKFKLRVLNDELYESITHQIVLSKNLDNKEFKTSLYQFLNSKYVNCEYEDFASVFVNGNEKISWNGSLVDLVLLFKGTHLNSFTDPNYNILESLVARFTHNGQNLKYETLKSTHSRVLKDYTKVKFGKLIAFIKKYS